MAGSLASAASAGPGEPGALVNTAPPSITGQAVFDHLLRADPGTWDSAEATFTYEWLRDGDPVRHATAATYRLGLADLGHRISVRVTATDETGATSTAISEPTSRVARATLRNKRLPVVKGVARFTHTIRATAGRWSTDPTRIHFQWLRNSRAIQGATKPAYHLAAADVGRRVRVRVTVKAPGYSTAEATSAGSGLVRHRVDVRRTVTYHVETRGRITASVRSFRRLAQQTYEDPRGWRGSGVQFRRVAKGGSFTLVLAEASRVPGFSSACSSSWSCRVGR